MSARLTWLPDDRPGSCLYHLHILEITQGRMGHYGGELMSAKKAS
jgi:hypothetical protein